MMWCLHTEATLLPVFYVL